MDRNNVVLVDKKDKALGVMEKIEAHQKGVLHRAFSIFIFNSKGELLLQQRSKEKYHGGGLWTNTCCSHPQLNEDILSSAEERLYFEMGIKCTLKEVFSFIYHTPVENGLIENEYDHVFVGFTNEIPNPNPNEVQNFKFVTIEDLESRIKLHPNQYTYWFKNSLKRVIDSISDFSI